MEFSELLRMISSGEKLKCPCLRCVRTWLYDFPYDDFDSMRIRCLNKWLREIPFRCSAIEKQKFVEHTLKYLPSSKKIWLVALEIENSDKKKLSLLERATKNCVFDAKLCEHFINISDCDDARRIKRARKGTADDFQSCLERMKVEEKSGNPHLVNEIINQTLITLADSNIKVAREKWMRGAIQAEKDGAMICCHEIITCAIGSDDEDRNFVASLMNYIYICIQQKAFACARELYRRILLIIPSNKNIWIHALFHNIEIFNTTENLDDLLKLAFDHCTKKTEDIHYLLRAKMNWIQKSYFIASCFFERALKGNGSSELLATGIEAFQKEYIIYHNEMAQRILSKDYFATSFDFKHCVEDALILGDLQRADILLYKGIKLFPKFADLYIMKAKVAMEKKDIDLATKLIEEGILLIPDSESLVIMLSQLNEKHALLEHARHALKRGRQWIQIEGIYLYSIFLERRYDNPIETNNILSQALKQLPSSRALRYESISRDSLTDEERIFEIITLAEIDNMRNDPYVLLAKANYYFSIFHVNEARQLFSSIVTLYPEFGDAWAYFYKFEKYFGTSDSVKRVLYDCIGAAPSKGYNWRFLNEEFENWFLTPGCILEKLEGILPLPFNFGPNLLQRVILESIYYLSCKTKHRIPHLKKLFRILYCYFIMLGYLVIFLVKNYKLALHLSVLQISIESI